MGTSYGLSRSGRWALDCAECGIVGGVRKRRCPVGYCPSAQLCAVCYATERQSGAWAKHHAECPHWHAEYEAREAAKRAEPEQWARSARGDWAPDVPSGMVEVITHAGDAVLVSKSAYQPSERGFGR